MKKITPGPWLALKEHEYYDENGKGQYFDLEEGENPPYVRICSAKQTITTNHDLFTFKNPKDAEVIALVPDMVEVLEKSLQEFKDKGINSDIVKELEALIVKINK